MASKDRGSVSFIKGEFLTWTVGAVIYAGWAGLTLSHDHFPGWILFILGGLMICWHGSLQHETIHGHPTRNRRVNALLGYLPLGLIYPYPIYRDIHLTHHATDHLTHPAKDPESFYIFNYKWRELPRPVQALFRFNHTALGRLSIGPLLVAGHFLVSEWSKLFRGDRKYLLTWQLHLVLVAGLLHWVTAVCQMPLTTYLLCFVYPGLSLTLLRSYLEHRPAALQAHRSAVVEGSFLSVLYLGVNYHSLHHREPWIPWYQLDGIYKNERETILEENGGYHFENYGEVIRRYALTTKDSPVFPDPLQ